MQIRTRPQSFKITFVILLATTVFTLFMVACSTSPEEKQAKVEPAAIPTSTIPQTTPLPAPSKLPSNLEEPLPGGLRQDDIVLGRWYCLHYTTSSGVISIYLVSGPFDNLDGEYGQYYLSEHRLLPNPEMTVAMVDMAANLGLTPNEDGSWSGVNWLTAGKCDPALEDATPASPPNTIEPPKGTIPPPKG